MAKRFTDTNKWDHAWFRKLTPKHKVIWIYVLDKCDHAGVWTADFEAMSFNIGDTVVKEEFEAIFDEKIKLLKTDKYIIKSFVEFQYGTLNPENRVHASVISRVEKLGANKGLIRTLQGAKDKDKEKDKDKDSLGGCGGIFKFDPEEVYKNYPRKEGKEKGIERLKALVKSKEDLDQVNTAIKKYSEHCRKNATEVKYIRMFSTFMSSWKEWLDSSTGSGGFNQSKEDFAKNLARELECSSN